MSIPLSPVMVTQVNGCRLLQQVWEIPLDILGWPKSSFGFFQRTWQKTPNELSGQSKYLSWHHRPLLLVPQVLTFDDAGSESRFQSEDWAKGSCLLWGCWSEPSCSFLISFNYVR